MLGGIDEFVLWEVEYRCNLTNAIFSQTVNLLVGELRKERCFGCEVKHPSQRRHDCLMMTEGEGWENYGLEVIEHVLQQGILSKQFTEAARVMKLAPHDQVTRHYEKLGKNHEATLELLTNLTFKAQLSKYQDILGYLYYWQEEH